MALLSLCKNGGGTLVLSGYQLSAAFDMERWVWLIRWLDKPLLRKEEVKRTSHESCRDN
jgi:hypothetical protein